MNRIFTILIALCIAFATPLHAQRISALTELTSPATGDLLPITDISDTTDAGSGTTKRITIGNLSLAITPPLSGLTGAGTGVLTALAVNTGSAGSVVLFNGAGGTPSSITLTNATGTAASLTAGNATLAATVTAANEATDTTCFPLFVTAATGSLAVKTNAGLTLNSATGTFTCASAIVTGGITLNGNITPSVSFPSLTSFGLFGATGEGVKFIGDGTYTGVGNKVTATSEVSLLLFTNNTARVEVTHAGALVTTGNIELGHATDTTISRGGAGSASIEGVEIATASNTLALSNKSLSNVQITPSTLTYAASTAIDFSSNGLRTCTLTGDITFTTSNLAAGRCVKVRIIGDGSIRSFTFPGGWTFVGGAAPASIAASKTAVLTLISFSTTDANVIATYDVQP